MAIWLFLVFVGVPILEIALFIKVGGAIGLVPTLLIVVLTAIGGTALMRRQGMAALARLRSSLDEGGDPAGAIAHGALILVAGMLLLTPGFFTDGVGLLLLVPGVRDRVIAWGGARLAARASVRDRTGPTAAGRPETIETDYEIVGEAPRRPGTSGWTRPEG